MQHKYPLTDQQLLELWEALKREPNNPCAQIAYAFFTLAKHHPEVLPEIEQFLQDQRAKRGQK